MFSCEASSSQSKCDTAEERCPVETSAKMGNKAFFEEMHQVQVESLKERIKKAWGEKIDQKSDAVVKALGTYWHSMLEQAKVQKELREEIQKIYSF